MTKALYPVTVLTALAAHLAFGATDENGQEPTHWYKFDGDSTSYGASAISFDGGKYTYEAAVSGQAMVLGTPWCHNHAALGDAFTFVTAAKSTTAAGKHVLWCRGDGWGRSFGLYAEGNTIGVFCWDNNKTKKANWYTGSAARVLLSTTVNAAAEGYHSYAVTYAEGVLSLSVDGVKKADTSALTDMISFADLSDGAAGSTPGRFQFGSMHGNLGGGMSNGVGCFIDDYRFYAQALTAEQLTAIAAPYVTPVYWYKFDGDTTSYGSQNLSMGGTLTYIDSANGQAIKSGAPYGSNHAKFTPSFSVVTAAKSGLLDRRGVIWARGTKGGKAIGLYLTNDDVGLFKWTSGGTAEYFATAEVPDASTTWHSYGVVYADGKFTLYVDGVKKADSGNLELNPSSFVDDQNYQIGSVYAGLPGGLWNARDNMVLIDDYRYYTKALSTDELTDLSSPVAGKPAQGFDFKPTATGNTPWGWLASWAWNVFEGPDAVVGPAGYGLVYPVKSGTKNHAGSDLEKRDKRTFAVYANVEQMTLADTGVYYTLLGVGGSTSGHSSVNLICFRKADGTKKVKLAYIKNVKHDGGTAEVDVTDFKGYHLYVFTTDSETGTTLSVDGGEPIADTSDKAKFLPTNGLQIGVPWEGQVFRLGEGAAIAHVMGFDKVLTTDEIAGLAAKYPATQTASTDIDMTAGGTLTSHTETVAAGKRIGVSNGTWEIPAGVEVQAERVRCMNRETTSDVATMNLAGTLTINADATSDDVYSHGTGVLFGHYRGVGTYNITGTLDASRAYVQLRYSAADQTVNLNGGTLKAKGVKYVDWNGATGNVLVNLSNGATVEISEATGFQTPCAVLSGVNTLKIGKSYTHGKPLSIAEGATLAVEVAAEQTMTFNGAAGVTGDGVFRKAGDGEVVFTTGEAPQKIELAAGTVKVPSSYAGSVKSAAKGMAVCRKVTDAGITFHLGRAFSIMIL